MEKIKVRLYATAEIRVHVDTEIDRDEFTEWYEESGEALDPGEIPDYTIVEFIRASPDSEYELSAQFPAPNVEEHDLMSFTIDEAEVLATKTGDNR